MPSQNSLMRQMFGLPPEEDEQVSRMLALSQPEPEPDMPQPAAPYSQPAAATDMASPGADPSLGHPDVLAFMQQLDSQGAFQPAGRSAPKGMVAGSQTVKGEEGGVPGAVKAAGVAAQGQEQLDNGMVDSDRLHTQADELEKRAAMLRQDAEAAKVQREAQEKDNAAKQERLRSQQASLAAQVDEPINPHRYFDDMGIFSKATALISAGIYGYLGGRGQPPVAELLMRSAKEDTDAQMANAAAGRAKRSTIMDQYEREYGDTTLVGKRLEADKLLEMSKDAQAQAADAKSAEAKAAGDDLAKKLQNRVGVIHNEIQQASYGKPVEVSTSYGIPKRQGSGEAMKEALQMREQMEKAGYGQETIAAELKRRGLNAPEGKSAFASEEDRKTRDQDIQEAKVKQLPESEKMKLIEKVDGLANARHGFDELDKQAGIERDREGNVTKAGPLVQGGVGARQLIDATAGSAPWGIGKGIRNSFEELDPEDLKALRRSIGKITTGLAHAESGAGVNEDEMLRYEKRMPTSTAEGFQRGSAEMFREQKQKYKNLVGQYGRESVDEMLRKRGIDPGQYGQ